METLLYFKIIGWIFVYYIIIGDVIALIEMVIDGFKYGWFLDKKPSDEVYGDLYITLSLIWPIVLFERAKKAINNSKK